MKKKKRHQRILLPGGCSMSQPSIHPANWKQITASVSKKWYIFYRFYDPIHKPEGKPKLLKGMNDYKTAESRRQATQTILDDEMSLLKSGWNPVTDQYVSLDDMPEAGELNEHTPLPLALRIAQKKLTCAGYTQDDIRSMMYWVPIAIEQCNFARLPVGEVKKKHIRAILDKCSGIKSRVAPETKEVITVKEWSNHKFNKYRSYLMILFSEIAEAEAIEQNPCRDMKKRKKTKRIRQTLTKQERFRTDALLRWFVYEFWRFLHIFFHSGCRESEMMLLQGKHVNLEAKTFVRMVLKGQSYEEKEGTIKDIALEFWKEAMEGCGPEDYLFSKRFQPGALPINPRQIGRYWKRWVKRLLGITADFYSLKHSNTTETSKALGAKAAAKHNGQEGEAMVIQIYDVDYALRMQNEIRQINNPFT